MKVAKSKLVIFSVAVAFVSVFFFAYAVQAVYPAPEREDFCGEREVIKIAENQSECVGEGGQWTDNIDRGVPMKSGGWCDSNFSCRNDYEEARKPYERNVFFANLIIGLIVLVVAFFLAIEAVSSGLMGGAVMLIVYGSMRYWGELSDVWRTLMLGVALVVLITLGYRKLKD